MYTVVGATAFSESSCYTDQDKSTFPLWGVVNFGEILKGGKILTTLAKYSRVIYQSIGNFMLITNNISTEVHSVLVTANRP